jgi:hypothetical protein
MNKAIKTPINKLCDAGDLLEQAQAVAMFVTGAITRENPDSESGMCDQESHGFQIVMYDMIARIAKANALLDEVRSGGAEHG